MSASIPTPAPSLIATKKEIQRWKNIALAANPSIQLMRRFVPRLIESHEALRAENERLRAAGQQPEVTADYVRREDAR